MLLMAQRFPLLQAIYNDDAASNITSLNIAHHVLVMITSLLSAWILEYMRHTFLTSMLYWSCTSQCFRRLVSRSRGLRYKQKITNMILEIAMVIMFSRYLTSAMVLAMISELIAINETSKKPFIIDNYQRMKIIGRVYNATQYTHTPTQLHAWCLRMIRHGPRKQTLLSVVKSFKKCQSLLFKLGISKLQQLYKGRTVETITHVYLVWIFITFAILMIHGLLKMLFFSPEGMVLAVLLLISKRQREDANHVRYGHLSLE